MTDAQEAADAAVLADEFRRLARYLAGADATPYQTEKYLDFHRRRDPLRGYPFDRLLLKLARSGWIGLALADSYSGALARTSQLRAKLIVALAILECSPPSFRTLDAPDPIPRLALLRMAARGAAAGAALLLALILLAPAHLWLAASRRAGL